MVKPLVSVITPTWGRHELLLNRCIPSVQAQAYPKVEHIVVSDGPDEQLTGKMIELASGSAFCHVVQYLQLPGPHPGTNRYGGAARRAGIEASLGAYICYIDDDDSLRPDHVRTLAAALDASPDAGFAYSLMESHSNSGLATHIGTPVPAVNQIGTPMIMHRRETLEHGTWGLPSATEDWELVDKWVQAGVSYVHVPEVTVDVWPSAYWG